MQIKQIPAGPSHDLLLSTAPLILHDENHNFIEYSQLLFFPQQLPEDRSLIWLMQATWKRLVTSYM